MLKKLLQVAEHLRDMGNFHTLLAILAGVERAVCSFSSICTFYALFHCTIGRTAPSRHH